MSMSYIYIVFLFVVAAILYPIDLVKVRYQVYDKKGRAYGSLLSAFTTIAKTEGIQGLYQVLHRQILARPLQ